MKQSEAKRIRNRTTFLTSLPTLVGYLLACQNDRAIEQGTKILDVIPTLSGSPLSGLAY